MQNTKKIFCFPKKKSELKTKKFNNEFWKSHFSNSIADALRDLHSVPPNTKDLAINQMMVAYGNRKKTQQRSHEQTTPISLRVLKHLMETRLYSTRDKLELFARVNYILFL